MSSPSRLARTAQRLSMVSEWSGRLVAWLVLAMTLLVGYDVGLRYLFGKSSVAMQELEWHLFALVFLLGAAYTLKHNGHVRVEVLYQKFSPRTQAWLDLAGTLLFLVPFCILIIVSSMPFVGNSFHFNEMSPDPGGLTHRYLLKAAIPVGFVLLLLQGIADAAQKLAYLFGNGEQD
jgi:TRAP-type mannitol/chloroaromatic compound transport system permease small subunit